MKYQYFYQNKKNENLSDWIVAKDRSDAYAQLKKKGIKPYKLIGKNPLAWKRWAAIALLTCGLIIALIYILHNNYVHAPEIRIVPRHQVYGDPVIVAQGVKTDWNACNLLPGEKFLSRYAQPGLFVQSPQSYMVKKIIGDVQECLTNKLDTTTAELTEYTQIKEIIESIKIELRTYINEGGTVATYLYRLVERQQQEVAYYNAAMQEIENAKSRLDPDQLYYFWAKKNSELRAIGLPMIKFPQGK